MKKSNILTYSISASLLIVALSVAYYFLFLLPKSERMKTEAIQIQQQNHIAKTEAYRECSSELKKRTEDPEFAESLSGISNTMDNVQKVIDIYIGNCMKQKGF